MRRTTGITASAGGSLPYFCGWAITGRSTVAHLVASAGFPLAGSRHRAWRGQMITVVARTLNARGVPGNCAECNQHLRMMAITQRIR